MPFFSRILKFPRALLARLRDQRKQPRYRVGADFPLNATVSLSADDGALRQSINGGPGSNWSGRVSDISANGLSVRLPVATATARNETSTVRIALEGRELAIPCTVAHFRSQPAHALCGLRLDFADFAAQKSFLQIVEAVSLGSSFAPVGGDRAPRVSLGLARRQWRSLKHAKLTEWRETGTRKLDRFELLIEEHRIEGRMTERGVTISPETNRAKSASPSVEAELREFFLWVVANMPASVPADLKEFMRRAATTTAAAAAQHATKPPVTPTPPTEWAPPKRPARR